MFLFFPFIFGLIMGSFLNVIALRYHPDKFILHSDALGGRSHCPHCGTQLQWFELIPLVSYFVQGGLCRSCRNRISLRYPLVELASGTILALAYWKISEPLGSFSPVPILWGFVFLTLFLIALIDIRWKIIPDELNFFIILLAVVLIYVELPDFTPLHSSFLGHYALIFGIQKSIWLNHLLGLLVSFLFFLGLALATFGKGMGGGDVKLAATLGFLFGWPDVALLIPLSFILGSAVALPLLLSGRRKRKDHLPFGPFLVAAAGLVFLYGFELVDFYFHLFRI